MNFKQAPDEADGEMSAPTTLMAAPEPKQTVQQTATQPAQPTQDDLFSAHDFDIKIDLEVPLPSKIHLFIIKPTILKSINYNKLFYK